MMSRFFINSASRLLISKSDIIVLSESWLAPRLPIAQLPAIAPMKLSVTPNYAVPTL